MLRRLQGLSASALAFTAALVTALAVTGAGWAYHTNFTGAYCNTNPPQYTNYFTKDANNGDLNWGRESFYHVLGFRWHTLDPNRNANAGWVAAGDNKRPRLWAYLDNFNPGGYLDGIDVNGVARGWTCDADRPWEAIPVDFYVNGQQTFVLKAWANQPSEAAVNNLCGGGTAHRFVVQMPAWTKGQPISAWGLDSTWRGFTQLAGYACAQNPSCVW